MKYFCNVFLTRQSVIVFFVETCKWLEQLFLSVKIQFLCILCVFEYTNVFDVFDYRSKIVNFCLMLSWLA